MKSMDSEIVKAWGKRSHREKRAGLHLLLVGSQAEIGLDRLVIISGSLMLVESTDSLK